LARFNTVSIDDFPTAGRVTPFNHDVISTAHASDILRTDALVNSFDLDFWVQVQQALLSRRRFILPNALGVEQNLAIKIAQLDVVEVDDSDIPDSCSGKIEK